MKQNKSKLRKLSNESRKLDRTTDISTENLDAVPEYFQTNRIAEKEYVKSVVQYALQRGIRYVVWHRCQDEPFDIVQPWDSTNPTEMQAYFDNEFGDVEVRTVSILDLSKASSENIENWTNMFFDTAPCACGNCVRKRPA